MNNVNSEHGLVVMNENEITCLTDREKDSFFYYLMTINDINKTLFNNLFIKKIVYNLLPAIVNDLNNNQFDNITYNNTAMKRVSDKEKYMYFKIPLMHISMSGVLLIVYMVLFFTCTRVVYIDDISYRSISPNYVVFISVFNALSCVIFIIYFSFRSKLGVSPFLINVRSFLDQLLFSSIPCVILIFFLCVLMVFSILIQFYNTYGGIFSAWILLSFCFFSFLVILCSLFDIALFFFPCLKNSYKRIFEEQVFKERFYLNAYNKFVYNKNDNKLKIEDGNN
jgi:hypothetical protein